MIPEFECGMDRRCQALLSNLETLVPSFLPKGIVVFHYFTSLIWHSENKIITHFENEVGSGVFRSSIQQTYNLHVFHTVRTESTHNQLHVIFHLVFLQHSCLSNAGLEHFRSDLVYRLRNNFIFEILY